jgi:hypothetical protein
MSCELISLTHKIRVLWHFGATFWPAPKFSVAASFSFGTPSALSASDVCRPRSRRRTTYPLVILSKLSPRYGDHARHGILHVSHYQGEKVPRAERLGCNLGETFVRLGSPDVSSRWAWPFPPSVA